MRFRTWISYSTISNAFHILYIDTVSKVSSLSYSIGGAYWLSTPRELKSSMLQRPIGSGVFVHAYGPMYPQRPA